MSSFSSSRPLTSPLPVSFPDFSVPSRPKSQVPDQTRPHPPARVSTSLPSDRNHSRSPARTSIGLPGYFSSRFPVRPPNSARSHADRSHKHSHSHAPLHQTHNSLDHCHSHPLANAPTLPLAREVYSRQSRLLTAQHDSYGLQLHFYQLHAHQLMESIESHLQHWRLREFPDAVPGADIDSIKHSLDQQIQLIQQENQRMEKELKELEEKMKSLETAKAESEQRRESLIGVSGMESTLAELNSIAEWRKWNQLATQMQRKWQDSQDLIERQRREWREWRQKNEQEALQRRELDLLHTPKSRQSRDRTVHQGVSNDFPSIFHGLMENLLELRGENLWMMREIRLKQDQHKRKMGLQQQLLNNKENRNGNGDRGREQWIPSLIFQELINQSGDMPPEVEEKKHEKASGQQRPHTTAGISSSTPTHHSTVSSHPDDDILNSLESSIHQLDRAAESEFSVLWHRIHLLATQYAEYLHHRISCSKCHKSLHLIEEFHWRGVYSNANATSFNASHMEFLCRHCHSEREKLHSNQSNSKQEEMNDQTVEFHVFHRFLWELTTKSNAKSLTPEQREKRLHEFRELQMKWKKSGKEKIDHAIKRLIEADQVENGDGVDSHGNAASHTAKASEEDWLLELEPHWALVQLLEQVHKMKPNVKIAQFIKNVESQSANSNQTISGASKPGNSGAAHPMNTSIGDRPVTNGTIKGILKR